MNIENILITDTETIDLNKRFIYDIGLIVASKNENGQMISKVEKQIIIKQVFDNKMLFNTAHHHKKRPLYTKSLKGRKAKRQHFGHSLRVIEKLMKDYNIQRVYAYNSPFDKRAFEFTIKYFGTRNIFKGKGWYDIHAIANNFIHNTEEYKEWCIENGNVSPKNYLRTNAEKTYAFLIGDPNYKEEHTGLEDSKIELFILNECIKRGYDFKHYRKKYIKIKTAKTLDI